MLLLLAPALALGAVEWCTHNTTDCSDTPQCMSMSDTELNFPCAPNAEPSNATLLAYNFKCSGTDLDIESHTMADCSGSVSTECQWEMGADGLLPPSGCHMPFVLGECKNLIEFMGMAVSMKFTGSCPSSSSGCMSYYNDAIAACDFDNPDNNDYSRFCSGACNAALTSAAAECTSTSTEVVGVKSMADQSLAVCSGCMSHALHFSSDCAELQDLLGEEDGEEDGMSGEEDGAELQDVSDISAMHAVVCGGGACYDRLTQASNDCAASNPNEAPLKSQSEMLLTLCSGCMSHVVHFSTDCAELQDVLGEEDGEEDGMSDISAMHAVAAVVCGGGACYDRLTQASNDCAASNPIEASLKNQSDRVLKLCSGCPALMVNAVDSCPGLAQMENPTGADVSKWCSGACKAAINSVSSGCDASQGDTEGEFKSGADNFLAYCQPPVVLTLTASGDPSDYADTTAIAASIATSAGVNVSLVTIEVAPGSVVITATIATPPSKTPAAVQSSLGSALGTDATTASAALGIPVQAAPAVAITPYPVPSPSPPPPQAPPPPPPPQAPPSPSTDDGGLPTGAIIGIAVGGGVLLLAVVVAVAGICCMKKNTKAISPEQ